MCGGQKFALGVFPSHVSTLIFEAGSLTEPGIHHKGSEPGLQANTILTKPSPQSLESPLNIIIGHSILA